MTDGEPRELPNPRFQPDPPRHPAETRKPLPRHIVEEILDASNARLRSLHPRLLEMEARRRAKREAEKAKKVRPPKRRTWDG